MTATIVPTMTDQEFNDALQAAAQNVRTLLRQKPRRDFAPLLVLHCYEIAEGPDQYDGPSVQLHLMPGFGMARRYALLRNVGEDVGRETTLVRAIFFITEAWLSVQPQGEPRKYALPEQDPNRQEVISVAGLTIDKRAAMARIAITRGKRERMIPGEISYFPQGGEVQLTNRICEAFFAGYAKGLGEAVGTLEPSP